MPQRMLIIDEPISTDESSDAFDSTDRQRVSIYGKQAAAGDTPVLVDSAGRPLVDIKKFGGSDVVLATSDGLTIAGIPVFIPGLSNNDTGAERLHSVSGLGDSVTFALLANGGYRYNGASWDKERCNQDNIQLLNIAGGTTSQQSADQTNYNARGLHVVFDMTTAGTGSVTLTIQAKDPVSGKYYTLLAGAAVTTISTNIYKVYPGLTAAANAAANDILPRTWRVITTANNANPTTYKVAASLVV